MRFRVLTSFVHFGYRVPVIWKARTNTQTSDTNRLKTKTVQRCCSWSLVSVCVLRSISVSVRWIQHKENRKGMSMAWACRREDAVDCLLLHQKLKQTFWTNFHLDRNFFCHLIYVWILYFYYVYIKYKKIIN